MNEGNEVKDRVVIGEDSNNNRWEMLYDAKKSCWRWIKYKGRDEQRELMKESNKTFKSKEDCEADARDHGMDGKFSI